LATPAKLFTYSTIPSYSKPRLGY